MKITCPDCQLPIEIVDSPKIKKLQSQGDFWGNFAILSAILGFIILIISLPNLAEENFGMLGFYASGGLIGFSLFAYLLSHIIYLRLDILSQAK
ncbi:MAG: hypothetical protein KGJ13_03490 [Patescibacteria group bacterium]|nr:hypothetical protein [Patescibacteria group bacterium]